MALRASRRAGTERSTVKLKTIRKFGLTPPAPAPPSTAKKAAVKPGAAKKSAAKKGFAAAAPASNVVATLELSVTKSGGPVATSIEVGSSGDDDQRFSDAQLTPGPVVMSLLLGNTYVVVWQGAFVAPGRATLKVKATDAKGNVFLSKSVVANRPPLDKTFTIVVL
jgi:hypothetical protein